MPAANVDPVGSDEAPNPLTAALAEAQLAAEAEARLVAALQANSLQLAGAPRESEPEPEPELEAQPDVESVDSPLVSTCTDRSSRSSCCSQWS